MTGERVPAAGAAVRLVVVLGSNADARRRLQQARSELERAAPIVAASEEVEAPSYLPGDASLYRNQALLLEWPGATGGFTALARDIERRLGRRREAAGAAAHDVEIDIDLVAGFGADGALLHLAPEKLAPELVRTLVRQVVSGRGRAELDAVLG